MKGDSSGKKQPSLTEAQAEANAPVERKLAITFIHDPKTGAGVALHEDNHCLMLLAIDTGPEDPLDEARKMQIAGAIETLYKACRGLIRPSRILIPGSG